MENSKPVVGVIANLFVEQFLEREYEVVQISNENILESLSENKITKLFIEMGIFEEDHDWFNRSLADLEVITNYLNIDVCLFKYEDSENSYFPNAKEIIITDNMVGSSLQSQLSIPFLIDERIHNPKNSTNEIDILFLQDKNSTMRAEFVAISKMKKYNTNTIKLSDISRVSLTNLITKLKSVKILYINDPNELPIQLLKYVALVATLSNTIVIEKGSSICEFSLEDNGDEDIIYLTQALIENRLFFDKTIISKTRKAFNMNSLIMFDEYPLNSINNLSIKKNVGISVLIATKRKEFIEKFIEQINKQLCVDAQIILITHGFSLEKTEYKKLNSLTDFSISFVECSDDMSFGNCLNKGMEMIEHDYVIKMDDDDYYYPNFIIDIYHGLEYSQDVLVGKNAFFFYLEQFNLVGQRRMTKQYKHVTEVKGNTLMCRTETMKKYGYGDLSRHVDSDFIQRLKDDGGKVYSIHPYDMCVYRASDKSGHTYQVDDSRFLRDANVLYYGIPNKTISSDTILS